MKIFTLLFTVLFGLSALAQINNCNPATAVAELNIGDVRATLLNGGDMWWNGVDQAGYEMPKVDPNSGQPSYNPIFAGGIWVSGKTPTNQLRLAAQTYRSQGHDFYPGPINQSGHTIMQVCNQWDRFFEVTKADVDLHKANMLAGNNASIPQAVIEWPGKNNAHWVNQGVDMNMELAPFFDCNGNGNYEPNLGDYPKIKGDQCLFWIINDVGNQHGRSQGQAMGMEIQIMAYAFNTPQYPVNYTTFYDYTLINKSNVWLDSIYFSQYADIDIANFNNNYIGCNVANNYGFGYYPPSSLALGVEYPTMVLQFIETPVNRGLSAFSYFLNGNCVGQCDPDLAYQYRYYQEGRWKDGTPQIDPLGGTTTYAYSANPAITGVNSECGALVAPGDRRFLMTTGPFFLDTNESAQVTLSVVGLVLNQSTNCVNTDSITPVLNEVKGFYNNALALTLDTCSHAITGIKQSANWVTNLVYPNPSNYNIRLNSDYKVNTCAIYNSVGQLVKQVNNGQQLINVQGMPSGVYFIKAKAEGNTFIMAKFIKP